MTIKSFFTRLPEEYIVKIDLLSKSTGKKKEQLSKEAFKLYLKEVE